MHALFKKDWLQDHEGWHDDGGDHYSPLERSSEAGFTIMCKTQCVSLWCFWYGSKRTTPSVPNQRHDLNSRDIRLGNRALLKNFMQWCGMDSLCQPNISFPLSHLFIHERTTVWHWGDKAAMSGISPRQWSYFLVFWAEWILGIIS